MSAERQAGSWEASAVCVKRGGGGGKREKEREREASQNEAHNNKMAGDCCGKHADTTYCCIVSPTVTMCLGSRAVNRCDSLVSISPCFLSLEMCVYLIIVLAR